MRRILLIIVLALILSMFGCTASNNSQKTDRVVNPASDEIAQQSAKSLFASSLGKPDCDLNVNLINYTFRLARIYSRKFPVRHVLIRERSTQTGCTNSEGLNGTIAIEGWIDKFDGGTNPSWQAQNEGHEGNIDGDFYKITKHGCCGSTEASVYFNLLSGKKVFESTGELVHIEVPNTANTRYVAFLDTQSILNPDEAKKDSNVIGALEYGSADGPPQRIILRLKTTNPFSVEDFSVASNDAPLKFSKTLELWSANGNESPAAIGGFKIRVHLVEVGDQNRELTIVIPVSSDQLDLSHAEHPPGVELQRTQ